MCTEPKKNWHNNYTECETQQSLHSMHDEATKLIHRKIKELQIKNHNNNKNKQHYH